jgi:hypothetical protein
MSIAHALRASAALLAAVLTLGTLGGCATPQATLDQANNGAALTASLQQELREFRAAQARVAEERIRSLRSLQMMMARYEVASAFDQRVMEAAGNNDASSAMASLRRLVDSVAADEKELRTKQAAIDEAFAKVVSPVPQQAAQLKATQDALAVLGHHQSTEEKLRAVSEFAKGLKERIEKAKKAAQDAAGKPPSTSPPPSAPK